MSRGIGGGAGYTQGNTAVSMGSLLGPPTPYGKDIFAPNCPEDWKDPISPETRKEVQLAHEQWRQIENHLNQRFTQGVPEAAPKVPNDPTAKALRIAAFVAENPLPADTMDLDEFLAFVDHIRSML